MKDHERRELVNELRSIAIEFHDSQQLRERISRCLEPVDKLREQLAAMKNMSATEACSISPSLLEYVSGLEKRAVAAEMHIRALQINAQENAQATYAQISRLVDAKETAEAKIKAASEQKPVYWAYDGSDVGTGWSEVSRDEYDSTPTEYRREFYTRPIPPVDVQELQAKYDALLELVGFRKERIAELERKLAEQQAHLIDCATDYDYLQTEIDGFLNSSLIGWLRQRAATVRLAGSEELNTLLAQAREEGRKEALPDGWQVVPKEPKWEMLKAAWIELHGF